jgi:hypothetical protein
VEEMSQTQQQLKAKIDHVDKRQEEMKTEHHRDSNKMRNEITKIKEQLPSLKSSDDMLQVCMIF